MKIQKKYQGAIPLNRIASGYNESEINTYSTSYINNALEQESENISQIAAALGGRLDILEEHDIRLNGEPVYVQRHETHEDGSYTRGYWIQGFVGYTPSGGGEVTVQLPDDSLVRNMYGVLYYTGDSTFIPLNYANPAVPVFTFFRLRTRQVHINVPSVFGNSEFVLYVEYVIQDK